MDDQSLVEIGRDLAEMEMNRVVVSSKNGVQMNNGLFSIAVMAQHILATMAYNYVHQDGMNYEEALGGIMDDINQEIDFLEEQEMEIINPKGEDTND